ncbi:MAG TPA: multicopper oxidase domain-containing protein [Thermoanaerobaculia bacterium]|jgi:FtsP/CotA-like multicopper oxidase with cupredoxin domain|nr:multicopper oxidase domain-containing protein [Thermoanaerobaculia bacterium]
MTTRRDALKLGLLAGGSSLFAARAAAQNQGLIGFLCPPDDRPRQLPDQPPSPPAEPWRSVLFVPPVMQPVAKLDPQPDPQAHQRYDEFPPQKLYEIHEREIVWQYHPDPPYDQGSYSWGFGSGNVAPSTPGPTYRAKYGEPVLVRRVNGLPPVGNAKVFWALPSTTSHLHNAHTASESDGNPVDWIDSGEYWDHHYANFPAGHDPLQKLTTLWYHDHRLDFTAANVYAGLAGFYLLFDDEDTGDENTGWHLPSFPKYDIPLMLQDVRFSLQQGPSGTSPTAQVLFDSWNTDGMLGDRQTVNRRITPRFEVEARKYRLRLLNGGPSRFYELFLRGERGGGTWDYPKFTAITGDGNFLPEPLETESIFLGVGQRVDVILDFSRYAPGQHVYLHNLLQQINGAGPSGAYLDFDDPASFVMRFDVVPATGPDNSRIPDKFRPWPHVDLAEVKRERVWTFDYEGGLWTINGELMDPNRVDAGIDQGSAEIWTFRNGGRNWSHPIHSHFVEFLLLAVNGRPYREDVVQDISGRDAEGRKMDLRPVLGRGRRSPLDTFMGGRRRDVAILLPSDEVKVFMRWPDFLGKYVMHCHNVVHEDHGMMIRWDIVEPGMGFDTPRSAVDVYEPPPEQPQHLEIRPSNPTAQDGPSPPPVPPSNRP